MNNLINIQTHIDREHILSPAVIVLAQDLLDNELARIPAMDYGTARASMIMHDALWHEHLKNAREFDGVPENFTGDFWATKDNYHVALMQSARILSSKYREHCLKTRNSNG